jgi:glycine/sarcosine N-methyltransferase
MSLYASLASNYDELFPLPSASTPFLDSLAAARFPDPRPPRRALDLGCATGSQAMALAEIGWATTGIDSEKAMIDEARASAERRGLSSLASFSAADILEAGALFPAASFDLVLCLGNTLPHIPAAGLRSLLAQARSLLKPEGALVLQLLNYSLPRVGPGFVFPDARAGGLTMRRRYEAAEDGEALLRFVVELEVMGMKSTEEISLRPLSPNKLTGLLAEAGFGHIEARSSWGAWREPSGPLFDEGDDLYLIVVARLGR